MEKIKPKSQFEKDVYQLENDKTPKKVKGYLVKGNYEETHQKVGRLFMLLDWNIRKYYKSDYSIKAIIVPLSLEWSIYCQNNTGWEFWVDNQKVCLIKVVVEPYNVHKTKVVLEWYDMLKIKQVFGKNDKVPTYRL